MRFARSVVTASLPTSTRLKFLPGLRHISPEVADRWLKQLTGGSVGRLVRSVVTAPGVFANAPVWVYASGFMVKGSGVRVHGSGFRVSGFGFRVQDVGCGVRGSRFRI